jgi:2-hydroxychromene-2-carboxylate isomerase
MNSILASRELADLIEHCDAAAEALYDAQCHLHDPEKINGVARDLDGGIRALTAAASHLQRLRDEICAEAAS